MAVFRNYREQNLSRVGGFIVVAGNSHRSTQQPASPDIGIQGASLSVPVTEPACDRIPGNNAALDMVRVSLLA